ncbi:MAG: GNAT family N-acetyltransferase [Bacteroidetes bacterium]|nr:GNAT family N-acetyltransferase [Bacteroidota bacterium]
MNEIIRFAKTPEDIQLCCPVIIELRPHLAKVDLVAMVMEMFSEGFQLIFIEAEDGTAAAICGYRYLQNLFTGKHIYVDDLGMLPTHRGKGYGGALLDFVFEAAKSQGLKTVTLDSGHQRFAAHRLYLNKGFQIEAHHFGKKLDS